MVYFHIARIWHKAFSRHIELLVEGGEKTNLNLQFVYDDTICVVGKWLHGPGGLYSHLPEYADLFQKHRQFHIAASSLLKEHLAGNKAGVQEILSTSFRAASDAELAAIDVLEFAAASILAAMGAEADSAASPAHGGPARPALRIGYNVIDDQHMELSNLLERINDDPGALTNSETFADKFSAFEKIVSLHFDTEEAFMRRGGVPPNLMDQHIRDHQKILSQLVHFHLETMQGICKTAAEVYRLIKDDIRNHSFEFDAILPEYRMDSQ